jgi:uncharacterized protein YkwD
MIIQPTDQEQYMLELINRARSNPLDEVARNQSVSDLNQGLNSNTISSAAKPPLAFNPKLITAARDHSQWLLDNNVFSHTGVGGSSAGDRMETAGYEFTGSWSWGENLSWKGTTGTPDINSFIGVQHDGLFTSSGHRTNLMADNFREIGIGAIIGEFTHSDITYNAVMVTQKFATSGDNLFLTGVIYDDSVIEDNFYTIGEGVAGVTIEAVRQSDGGIFTTTSFDSGGYTLGLQPGTYTVNFSGSSLQDLVTQTITLDSSNVKLDIVNTLFSIAIPDNLTINPGQIITVPVNLNGATGVDFINLRINYDSAITLTETTFPPSLTLTGNNQIVGIGNSVIVQISGIQPITTDSITIAELTFEVPVETPAQEIILDLVEGRVGRIASGQSAVPAQLIDGRLTIVDTTEPSLAIAPTNTIRLEGNEGLTPFTFTVTRTGDTNVTSSANWTVTGTGANPANTDDFGASLPTGTFTFAPGVTSEVITVNVQGDTVVETDETFTVTLSNPNNATLTTATATGTIRNDDTPPVVSDRQQITSLDNLTAAPGGNVSIPLLYNTSTGDNTVTGISLRLHYNSNQLNFQTVENLFNNNLFVTVEDLADSRNLDNDPQSDRYIQFGYTDFAGNWPNQTLPLKLGDFNFTTTGNFTGTQLNLTSDNLAPNYSLEADPILVSKQEWNFDIDGNGEIKALSDGIMIVRHLFGTFPGERLTEGAMASNATRNLAEIQAYLQQGVDNKYLDIDGNGEIKALSDGIMIVRHLFGTFPDERLIDGAIASNATRDLTQIQAHLTQFSTVI